MASPLFQDCAMLAALALTACTPAPEGDANTPVTPTPAAQAPTASHPSRVGATLVVAPDDRTHERVGTRPAPTPSQSVPRAALPYRDDLIRTARAVWGLSAPVPVFAAQIHTESGWRADAVSPVGALGLAQFMPATARWISQTDPLLVEGQPYNPAWAMRAMVTYDQRLYAQAPARYTPHDRMWVALRGYNGGLGHWNNEARVAAARMDTAAPLAPPPGRPQGGAGPLGGQRTTRSGERGGAPSREQVDTACGYSTRAHKHCAENLAYPRRILIDAQPRYASWGPML